LAIRLLSLLSTILMRCANRILFLLSGAFRYHQRSKARIGSRFATPLA
jgi:hypothetical protein